MERLELVSKVASETNGYVKIMKTRSTTAFASWALLCGLCFLPSACEQSLDARCSEGPCDQRDGAPTGDSGDGGPVTDPCLANPTSPDCLDENKALFVSNPKGNDQDALGTRKKPFKTIGAALAKIDAARRRIYICAGTYQEDLSLDATHSGVSLFGGVDCEWASAPTVRPLIGATANPFKIDGGSGLTVADVTIEAKDATAGSSIAAFVNAASVAFKGVLLRAGAGGRGGGGATVPFTFPDAATTLKGKETVDNTGALENSFKCPGGVSDAESASTVSTVGYVVGGVLLAVDESSPCLFWS